MMRTIEASAGAASSFLVLLHPSLRLEEGCGCGGRCAAWCCCGSGCGSDREFFSRTCQRFRRVEGLRDWAPGEQAAGPVGVGGSHGVDGVADPDRASIRRKHAEVAKALRDPTKNPRLGLHCPEGEAPLRSTFFLCFKI